MTLIENKIKVFFDTNVVIDAFTLRDMNYRDSYHLMMLVLDGKIKGYICSKQITDIYYILRKYISDDAKRKSITQDISQVFEMLPLLPMDIKQSFNTEIKDYEDAVLAEIAKVNCINFLVTQNVEDYKNSSVYAITPTELYNFIINNKLI